MGLLGIKWGLSKKAASALSSWVLSPVPDPFFVCLWVGFFFFFCHVLIFLFMERGTYMAWCISGGQKTTYGKVLSFHPES